MPRPIAFLGHLAVLLAAWRWSDSAGSFAVNGPGLGLLLDRYLLRLLPWPAPIRWAREGTAFGVSFLLGAGGFYFARFGIVPWWEAVYRGAVICVIVFLVGMPVEMLVSPTARWRRLCLRGALVGLIVLLIPVIAAFHPLHTVPKRSPGAMGLAFEDVRFSTRDGVLLAGWLVPHQSARGNVVFCHGHGRNRGHVAGLLPTLHELGMNVLAFDFRGHGDSQGRTSTFGRREVNDLIAAVECLRERCPGNPLFLVGVSLGAAVSLQALPQLEDVRGVWSEGAFSRLDRVVENEFTLLPSCLRKPIVEAYHRAGWLDCGFWVDAVNPIDALRGQRVPIYFCHGCEDELVPLAEGEALYEACAGPKWKWWVEKATHYNIRQRNREEYLSRLRSFLQDGCRMHASIVLPEEPLAWSSPFLLFRCRRKMLDIDARRNEDVDWDNCAGDSAPSNVSLKPMGLAYWRLVKAKDVGHSAKLMFADPMCETALFAKKGGGAPGG